MTDDGADPWATYRLWNDAIAEHVFPLGQEGKPVFLQLDDEDLDAIGLRLGFDAPARQHFITAVRRTLTANERGGIFGRHVREARKWRSEMGERPDAPPCVGLLAVFVMAAEHMASGQGLSSNNYYDRLLLELGVPTPASESQRNELARQFRDHSPRFWQTLRSWLEAWDGRRGSCTATQVGGHRYIGVPISQALVRSQDRRHLRDFFASNGYDPADPPGLKALAGDLGRWINQPGSPASHALRELWNQGQRDVITEIVQQELAGWTGQSGTPNEDAAPRREIRLAIEFTNKGLTRKPELGLLVRRHAEDPDKNEPLELELETVSAVGVENPLEDIHLERTADSRWYRVEPSRELALGLGLESDISLRQASLGIRLTRDGRSVLPLRLESGSSTYIEEKKSVATGDEYVVLCHEDLADAAEALLHQVAGERVTRRDGPYGDVPPGWSVFTSVEVAAAPVQLDTSGAELEVLIPQPEYHFKVAGGLRLPGSAGTWHLAKPPEVGAASQDPSKKLALSAHANWMDAGKGAEDLDLGRFDHWAAYVHLDKAIPGLSDGDLSIALSSHQEGQPREVVRRAAVHLRSGNFPRSLSETEESLIARPLGRQWALETLTGVDLRSCSDIEPLLVGARLFTGLDDARRGHLGAAGAAEGRAPTSTSSISGGAVGEIYGRGLSRYDLLLDALTYARAGRWPSFFSMVRRTQYDSVSPYVIGRVLAGLGHIELSLARTSFSHDTWTIAPAALVVLPKKQGAVLVGQRSKRLLSALQGTVGDLDGSLNVTRSPKAPARILVEGLSIDDLELLAEVVSDDTGISVRVERDLPQAIISRLPCLRSLFDALPGTPMPAAAEAYDVSSERWTSSGSGREWQVLRTRLYPRLYGVATAEDLSANRMRVTDVSLATLLGRAFAGLTVATFDEQGRRVLVRGRGPLPVLAEKAMVLCSGELPRQDGAYRSYHNVPHDVGKQAVRLLTFETESEA